MHTRDKVVEIMQWHNKINMYIYFVGGFDLLEVVSQNKKQLALHDLSRFS